jgi:tripartite-type tricarboxylate transporter receptor subunit TctC
MTTARVPSLTFQAVLGLCMLAGATDSHAQPVNNVRIVVASMPGSPPDVISRIVATELAASNNWRVIVENRPGALYTLAIADVLKQRADGRTLLTVRAAAATPEPRRP